METLRVASPHSSPYSGPKTGSCFQSTQLSLPPDKAEEHSAINFSKWLKCQIEVPRADAYAGWLWPENAALFFVSLSGLAIRLKRWTSSGPFPPLMAGSQAAVAHGPSYKRIASDGLVELCHAILIYGLTSRLRSPSFQAI